MREIFEAAEQTGIVLNSTVHQRRTVTFKGHDLTENRFEAEVRSIPEMRFEVRPRNLPEDEAAFNQVAERLNAFGRKLQELSGRQVDVVF